MDDWLTNGLFISLLVRLPAYTTCTRRGGNKSISKFTLFSVSLFTKNSTVILNLQVVSPKPIVLWRNWAYVRACRERIIVNIIKNVYHSRIEKEKRPIWPEELVHHCLSLALFSVFILLTLSCKGKCRYRDSCDLKPWTDMWRCGLLFCDPRGKSYLV